MKKLTIQQQIDKLKKANDKFGDPNGDRAEKIADLKRKLKNEV